MPTSDEIEIRALGIVDEALEQPSDLRRGWIESRCGDQPELLAHVQRILAFDVDESVVLQTGGATVGGESLPRPERIGVYRIRDLIGQGGMGAVYLGERDSGDFDHLVAIKVIRPGALSNMLVERFERERQTLATLNHPNIARLYDGGESEGSPYIVMEYVQGEPLLDWCQRNRVGRAKRLRLFRDICLAVSHAHQNQVVHRDITPSNVLVTDGGVAKLIDFGIAHGSEVTAQGAQAAQVDSRSFTPGYAAPERLQGHPGNTLSDVFSLGRLLSELVPREDLDPDLDSIVRRATESRPEDRYPAVDPLIVDLERYASGHAVSARGGGATYTFLKFAGRNRGLVGTAALALLLLVAAIVGTSMGLFRAGVERDRALSERDRALAILRFWDGMWDSASPEGHGRHVRVVDVIGSSAFQLESDLTLDTPVRASLHLTFGRTYADLGVAEDSLDQLARAIELFESCGERGSASWIEAHAKRADLYIDLGEFELAIADVEQVEAAAPLLEDPPDFVIMRPLELRANLSWSRGTLEETIDRQREVLTGWLELSRSGTDEVETARNNLAVALLQGDRFEEAEGLLRESFAAREALFGRAHANTLNSASNLAMTLSNAGRSAEGLEILEELTPVALEVWGQGHPMSLTFRNNLASLLMEVGRHEESLDLQVELRDLHVERFGVAHHETQLARNNLAVSAMTLSRFDLAHGELEALLDIAETLDGPDRPQQLAFLNGNMASALDGLGRLDEAVPFSERSLRSREEFEGPGHLDTLISRNNHAMLLANTGRTSEAVALARKNLQLSKERLAEHPYNVFPFRMNLGRILAKNGDFEQGEVELLAVEAHLRGNPDFPPHAEPRIREVLREFYLGWGKAEEAARWVDDP